MPKFDPYDNPDYTIIAAEPGTPEHDAMCEFYNEGNYGFGGLLMRLALILLLLPLGTACICALMGDPELVRQVLGM